LTKKLDIMAAFMPKDPTDKFAYINKYTNLLRDLSVNNQTIVVDDIIIGSVAKFIIDGDTEIYLLDRQNFLGAGHCYKSTKGFS